MKIAVGLVVKGGKEFIDQWLECATKIAEMIFVVDNGADEIVRMKLLKCDKIKQYHIQKNMGRNQSRDYQKILDMAREEDCTWIINLDIDEVFTHLNFDAFELFLLNSKDNSIGFPLFEMRNDNKHFVMIRDYTRELKSARLCHKCYKVLSHFAFNPKDIHGTSIPHNCSPGSMVTLPIQHFGHYTKELRAEKKAQYIEHEFKDESEQKATWMQEDDKVKIRDYDKTIKELFPQIT